MKLILLLLAIFPYVKSNIILESTRVTNWGSWGSWDRCTNGTFATALQLKVERSVGDADDTALNGIKLHCAKIETPSVWVGTIQSKVERFGDWSSSEHCNEGFINGFQFRVEPSQGRGDDTSANDLKAFCTNSERVIGGSGMSWGDWGSELRCYRNQAICAIRTQVEDWSRDNDDTTLNNVDMECCDIPNPAATCTPRDNWEVVHICDGRNRLTPYTCRYSYTTGSRRARSTSVGGGNSQGTSSSMEFGMTTAMSQSLSTNFQSSFSTSSTTNHNWASESSTTWNSETSTSADFEIMPGHRSVLSQVVGYCGDFVIRTTSFRLRDYDVNGTLVDILHYQN